MQRVIIVLLTILSVAGYGIAEEKLSPEKKEVTKESNFIVKKDGFRSIKLGMTEKEVKDSMKIDDSDGSIEEHHPSPTVSYYTLGIGDYRAYIDFDYDNHGILFNIRIELKSVEADKIDPYISDQVKYFYDVLKSKYGKPIYENKFLFNKIGILDFKENYYVYAYKWTTDKVTRGIALSTSEFEYKIVILITDDVLSEIKEKEDKERENKSKNNTKKDF